MLVPCGQLVVSGIFQLDIAKIIGDVVLVQPCSRLLAGGAFGVADKRSWSHAPSITKVYFLPIPYRHQILSNQALAKYLRSTILYQDF